MNPLKQFIIPFTGLKIGKHQFDYEFGNEFFDAFEYSIVKKGNLKATVELDKQETMLILNFEITGDVTLSCDTCLSDVQTPVAISERQIFKFAEDDLESDDMEIIMLNKRESAIDIAELIYEFINSSLPYTANCGEENGESKCDKEMLEKIKSYSVRNNDENKNADPRWEALKNLK